MQVHLVDGTYELFRAYYGPPKRTGPDGREVGATLALARSLLALPRYEGATHVGVAFDHVVESFRNGLFDGYKTGEGIEPDLRAQFDLAERMTRALGFVVWPMVEFEADDALASAAAKYRLDDRVERVCLCSPDKDLAQCVDGDRVVLIDRRRRATIDEDAVVQKYGVRPASIPDWLALVGDAADGIPGVPRWGARSSSAALFEYGDADSIPDDPAAWTFKVRGAATLAKNLASHRDQLKLYRQLATLREDAPIADALDDLEWRGACREPLTALCGELGDDDLPGRVTEWRT